METFKRRYVAETKAAVAALNGSGDANVYYLSTEGWLTSANMSDNVHPNDSGHVVIADRLAPIIAARL